MQVDRPLESTVNQSGSRGFCFRLAGCNPIERICFDGFILNFRPRAHDGCLVNPRLVGVFHQQ
jgi:hypothetical protein